MHENEKLGYDRREFLRGSTAIAGATAAGVLLPTGISLAQQAKLKVGLMLPYTGTYAQLGVAITNGFKLAVEERGGKLGGREIEYFTVDDESNPAKAPENTNKLVQRDKVDVVIGTVHSGVAMGMAKVLKAKGHKNAVFITWKYAAGEQMMQGFKEGFENEGGKLTKELYVLFP